MRLGSSAYAQPSPLPRMPPGLVELMEGLGREVLRRNPPDLHQFCADHMHKLLVLRAAHEGRTRTMTLEEKIARAQKIVRQRAEKRRRRYDHPDQQSPGYSDEEESGDSDTRVSPLGLSPRMRIPAAAVVGAATILTQANKTAETKEVLDKEAETHDGTAEVEEAEKVEVADNDQTAVNISDTEETKDIAADNVAEKELQGNYDCGNVQDVIESVQNVEDHVDKNDDQKEENKTTMSENIEEEFAADNATEKELHNGSAIQDALKTEPTVEVPMYEKDEKKSDIKTAESENPDESKTNENSVVDGNKSLNIENPVENGAVLQECDELPIENHIIEEDTENPLSNETSGVNEPQQQILEKGQTESKTGNKVILAEDKNITPTNENTEKTSETPGTMDERQGSSEENKEVFTIESDIVVHDINFVTDKDNHMAEMNAAVDINDQSNDGALPDVKTSSEPDGGIEIKLVEKEVIEAENSVVKTDDYSEIDISEVKDVVILDNNIQANDPIIHEMKSVNEEVNPVNDFKIENEGNAEMKHEEQENIVTEQSSNKDTKSKMDVDNDNHLEIKSDDVERKVNPQKRDFESVTIEVKAPTPLPEETEVKDEINEKPEVSTTAYIVGSDEPATKENGIVVPEIEKNIENHDERPLDIKGPETAAAELNNDLTKNGIETVDLQTKPAILDENALKENEVIIHAQSSSNEDETDYASDNNAEVKHSVDNNHSATHDTESMSYMTAPGHNIDINALAKSDSTNDMIIEETTESISETNTEADEREESSNNTSAMDLETAAVTIQKVFRTFLFKSRASTLDDVSNDEGSMDVAMPEDILSDEGEHVPKQDDEFANIKERRTLGITRMDTVLQTVNEEKSLSLSTDDSSTLSSAATTIQAHVRGFLVRNRLHSNKTTSLSSLVNSDGHSSSLDAVDNEQQKSKTVLNIHIVPEGGHFMSRDESMAMSLDLPLDNSPPSSLSNLHPLSYDVSEKRKLLKREDAIQSISPPSTNSGKLSEDSVKEISITESDVPTTQRTTDDDVKTDVSSQMEQELADLTSGDTSPTKSVTVETVVEVAQEMGETKPSSPDHGEDKPIPLEPSADEMDVVTPFVELKDKGDSGTPRLLHSGECHDVVLPTCVSRSETAVVREFKTVLGYFIIWNNAS